MLILSLKNLSLSYGHHALLNEVNLDIYKGQRICLIGRNGAGKSSLLKIMSKDIKPDAGDIISHDNAIIATLPQEVPTDMSGTIFEIAMEGFDDLGKVLLDYEKITNQETFTDDDFAEMHRLQLIIEKENGWEKLQEATKVLTKLNLDKDVNFNTLSGGMKRRVLLAKSLVSSPDILLLDEPTNHLDIDSIKWLEEFLPQFKGAIVFISHDRAFLKKVANEIVELDRGRLIRFKGDYNNFIMQKEALLNAEQQQEALFDKRLANEEKWIRQGVKARRTRNEGRVRALEEMRKQRQQRRNLQSTLSANVMQSEKSGKIVIKAENISFSYKEKPIFKPLNLEIHRGDKIAIIGANGCGKSTLLNILLKKLQPDTGTVEHGTSLKIAYFDQLRNKLDLSQSVINNVADGSEYVEINNNKVHVISYLQNFLFTPERIQSPVSSLSGGERNRLLLAKIFARPSNLLILDEPTNDLDIETLEVLEDLIINYSGTLILVSHDRSFIENIAGTTLVFKDHEIKEYIGGYEDWIRQTTKNEESTENKKSTEKKQSNNKSEKSTNKKITFTQQERLKNISDEIDEIDKKIKEFEAVISSADFYKKEKNEILKTQTEYEKLTAIQSKTYAEWEELLSMV